MFLSVPGRLRAVTVPQGWVENRRKPLAERVQRRRLELGLSKDAAAAAVGMSTVTWSRVEGGRPVRALTYIGIDRALNWATGSCLEFLDSGKEPVESPEEAPPVGPPSQDDGFVSRQARTPDVGDLSEDELLALIRQATDEMARRRGSGDQSVGGAP